MSDKLLRVEEANTLYSDLRGRLKTANQKISTKIDDAESKDGYLILKADGVEVKRLTGFGGGTGGSGGSVANNARITIQDNLGWVDSKKTFAQGSTVKVSVIWSSLDNGNSTGAGSAVVYVNNVLKVNVPVLAQGVYTQDMTPYLSLGSNTIRILITDSYGNTAQQNYTVIIAAYKITADTFITTNPFTGNINFAYTVTGEGTKRVYFYIDETVDPDMDATKLAALDESKKVGSATITARTSTTQISIPKQPHGSHKLNVFFTVYTDEYDETSIVFSNVLEFSIMCIDSDNTDPIISYSVDKTEINQYDSVKLTYQVYDPEKDPASIEVFAKVGTKDYVSFTSSASVNRGQSYEVTYQATEGNPNNTKNAYDLIFKLKSGDTEEFITVKVIPSTKSIGAVTANQMLYLTAKSRNNNNEETNSVWKDEVNNVSCELTGFNWSTNGWLTDTEGTYLRVSNGASVTIPIQPMYNFNDVTKDIKATGRTIEFEFRVSNISDYDAILVKCYDAIRSRIGFRITAQEAILYSSSIKLSTQFKEDSHVRITFVITSGSSASSDSLIYVYVNGIISGIKRYSYITENFSQTSPQYITIGSDDAFIDIFNIRIYDIALTRTQVVDNWIADMQNSTLMDEYYDYNNIFYDETEANPEINPEALLDLPYMIVDVANALDSDGNKILDGDGNPAGYLPQYKGDKKQIAGRFVDPKNPARNFSFTKAQFNVQGTSSQGYPRKNYKIKFKNFTPTSSVDSKYQYFDKKDATKGYYSKYKISLDAVPTATFTFKADYASSEGANNVELVDFYNKNCPYKTPPQKSDEAKIVDINTGLDANGNVVVRRRQGIAGFPIAMFGLKANGDTYFIGKYNFNNDKGTDEVYGFSNHSLEFDEISKDSYSVANDGVTDECWETGDNQSPYTRWIDYPEGTKFEIINELLGDISTLTSAGDLDGIYEVRFPSEWEDQHIANKARTNAGEIAKVERFMDLHKWVTSTDTHPYSATSYPRGIKYRYIPLSEYKPTPIVLTEGSDVSSYYTRSGNEGAYIYTKATGTYVSGTDYFISVGEPFVNEDGTPNPQSFGDVFELIDPAEMVYDPDHDGGVNTTIVAGYYTYNSSTKEYTVVAEEKNTEGVVTGPKWDGVTNYYRKTSETFYYDDASYRLSKFKAQFEDYFDVDDTVYYYVFTELFLMIDSRVKNSFPTYFADVRTDVTETEEYEVTEDTSISVKSDKDSTAKTYYYRLPVYTQLENIVLTGSDVSEYYVAEESDSGVTYTKCAETDKATLGVTYYKKVPIYTRKTVSVGSDVSMYYTDNGDGTYTSCGENAYAQVAVKYFSYNSLEDIYTEVTTGITRPEKVSNYYYVNESGEYVKCAENAYAERNVAYYTHDPESEDNYKYTSVTSGITYPTDVSKMYTLDSEEYKPTTTTLPVDGVTYYSMAETGDWQTVTGEVGDSLEGHTFYVLVTKKHYHDTDLGTGRWAWVPYDMDTAIGINNEGELVFNYNLEDIDIVDANSNIVGQTSGSSNGDEASSSKKVFNGQDSVLWNNLRDCFGSNISARYASLRTGGVNYSAIEKKFENHQKMWPAKLINEDAYYKYVKPLLDPEEDPQNPGTKFAAANYLDMCLGTKEEQRKWWLYNRFRYMDSKYTTGDSSKKYIYFRAYQIGNGEMSITPYTGIYVRMRVGKAINLKERVNPGETLDIKLRDINSGFIPNDTETYIYSADQLQYIKGLSNFNLSSLDISAAERLLELDVDGFHYVWNATTSSYDAVGTNGVLQALNLESNKMLKKITAKNCTFMSNVSAAKCINLKEIDLVGCTSLTNVSLPDGGVLKSIYLPAEKLTGLYLNNQSSLEEIHVMRQVSSTKSDDITYTDTQLFDNYTDLPSTGVSSKLYFVKNAYYDVYTWNGTEYTISNYNFESYRTYDKTDYFPSYGESTNIYLVKNGSSFDIYSCEYNEVTEKYVFNKSSILCDNEKYENISALPTAGETNKYYFVKNAIANIYFDKAAYNWNGTYYVYNEYETFKNNPATAKYTRKDSYDNTEIVYRYVDDYSNLTQFVWTNVNNDLQDQMIYILDHLSKRCAIRVNGFNIIINNEAKLKDFISDIKSFSYLLISNGIYTNTSIPQVVGTVSADYTLPENQRLVLTYEYVQEVKTTVYAEGSTKDVISYGLDGLVLNYPVEKTIKFMSQNGTELYDTQKFVTQYLDPGSVEYKKNESVKAKPTKADILPVYDTETNTWTDGIHYVFAGWSNDKNKTVADWKLGDKTDWRELEAISDATQTLDGFKKSTEVYAVFEEIPYYGVNFWDYKGNEIIEVGEEDAKEPLTFNVIQGNSVSVPNQPSAWPTINDNPFEVNFLGWGTVTYGSDDITSVADEENDGYRVIVINNSDDIYAIMDWPISEVSVSVPPTKKLYYVGETFNPTGMVILAKKEIINPEGEQITTDPLVSTNYTYSPTTALTSDTRVVTITLGEATTTYDIGVAYALTVTETSTYTTLYNTGERWNPNGLMLTVSYYVGEGTDNKENVNTMVTSANANTLIRSTMATYEGSYVTPTTMVFTKSGKTVITIRLEMQQTLTANVNAKVMPTINAGGLNNNTWADIAVMASEGLAENIWNVGDEKTVTIETSSSVQYDTGAVTFRILGFDHNTEFETEGKHTITFGLAKATRGAVTFEYVYGNGQLAAVSNSQISKKEGIIETWHNGCELNKLCDKFYNDLPSDLKDVIIPVKKGQSDLPDFDLSNVIAEIKQDLKNNTSVNKYIFTTQVASKVCGEWEEDGTMKSSPVFIPSIMEIFGTSTAMSSTLSPTQTSDESTVCKQFDYYKGYGYETSNGYYSIGGMPGNMLAGKLVYDSFHGSALANYWTRSFIGIRTKGSSSDTAYIYVTNSRMSYVGDFRDEDTALGIVGRISDFGTTQISSSSTENQKSYFYPCFVIG